MTQDGSEKDQKFEAWDSEGRPIPVELVTEAQSREARRLLRKRARTEREQAARILRTALRQTIKGRPTKARDTIMRSFGSMMVDALRRKLGL
jgi:hypothetical protein